MRAGGRKKSKTTPTTKKRMCGQVNLQDGARIQGNVEKNHGKIMKMK